MKQPNLLFIYTDEQAFNTLAAYGNTRIQMPNLNRLAEESVVFDQAYVSQPVCTPSRSTLLTGLYPHTNGCTENSIPLKNDTLCLPEMINKGSYITAHYGKWHLGDEIFPQHGFNEWCSIEDGYRQYYSKNKDPDKKSDYHHFLIKNGFTPESGDHFSRMETARLPEEYSKPAFLAERASRFIRENRKEPFILYVNFLEPHMPFFGPRDNQYNIEDILLPENFDNSPAESQSLKSRLFEQCYSERKGGLKNESDWRRVIANYWGLCSLVDTHAGTILKTLEECELKDNTIIVFTSDHGDMMGSHRLIGKCVMFEEAIRVPFLIRLPGQSADKRIMGPVSQIDIVPTLLDLMGQAIPEHLPGKSLKPFIENKEEIFLKEDVFVEWNGSNTGCEDVLCQPQIPDYVSEIASLEEIKKAISDPVRTIITPEGWKLNFSPRGEHELYNLKKEPDETQNLLGKEECNFVIKNLMERIRNWQKQTKNIQVSGGL